jgi:stage II sporulation protein GA (sporulation sigma-E factor processing peptidase)
VKEVIYLDSYFFMNLFLNSMLLYLLRRIRHLPGNLFRLFVGAVFGGAAACFLILHPSLPGVADLLFSYFFMAPGMILIAFGFPGWKLFFQNLCWFLGITIGLGGIVQFLTERYIESRAKKEGMGAGTGEAALLIMAAAGAAVLLIIFRKMTAWAERETCLCEVTVFLENRSIMVKGYLDSGNLLKEPLSGKPVMVLEEESFLELFEEKNREKIKTCFRSGGEPWNLAAQYGGRIRQIPYKSIGRKRGLLNGFIADRMIASTEEGAVSIVRPVLAVYSGTISADGGYQMILPGTLHSCKNKKERKKRRL